MPQADYQTVCCLIDSAYVRERLEELGIDWRKVNLYKLAEWAVRHVQGRGWMGAPMALSRVYVYDAVPDRDRMPSAELEIGTLAHWLRQNDDLSDVLVRYGRLIEGPKQRQKAVDIQLSVDAVSLALKGLCDALVLVAGDGDYVPIIEAIRSSGPLAAICVFEKNFSQDLMRAADRVGKFHHDPRDFITYLFEGMHLDLVQ